MRPDPTASTKQAAHGKWRGIIMDLLDAKAPTVLSRKHGPCPMCGGKDRYRFDDRHGNGDWFCNVCGAGDGFDLLMQVQSWDFSKAAAEVDKILYRIEAQPFQIQIDVEARRRLLNKVWADASRTHLVAEYLVSRGLSWDKIKDYAQDLRGTSLLMDVEHGNVLRPGMVALMRNSRGAPVSVHRTFFKTDQYEAVKKIMPPVETVVGAVIKLGEPTDTLVIGEGIETTLAGCQAFGLPGVAVINANNMVEYSPPSTIKGAIILADNDASFHGQWVAFQLAYKLRNQRKMEVSVAMPENPGEDMCDFVLRGGTLLDWNGGEPNGRMATV